MKLSLKILKAINKGLNEALADLIDDEDDSLYNSRAHSISLYANLYKKDLIWIKENFVDLGLPSGTLWCKYNLGATCLDTPESWYGHYYMWGSIKPNDSDNCCWKNTPFNNSKDEFDEDYFNEHMYELVDHNHNLLPEYDAAYQVNKLMHMPTRTQLLELNAGTTHKWIGNYNGVEGLNGMLFTSKANENTLFIPAAGCRDWYSFGAEGASCYLWSSSLYFSFLSFAYRLLFNRQDFYSFNGSVNRHYGQSVRGVINKKDIL